MAEFEVSPSAPNPQPFYEYTIRQRAALQLLSDAVAHLSQDPDEADVDAAWTLWGFREVVALDGLKIPQAKRQRNRGALSIVWRNPRVGAQ